MNPSIPELITALPELSDDGKHQLILVGLADVDAGRTISHAKIKSWVRFLLEASRHPNGEE